MARAAAVPLTCVCLHQFALVAQTARAQPHPASNKGFRGRALPPLNVARVRGSVTRPFGASSHFDTRRALRQRSRRVRAKECIDIAMQTPRAPPGQDFQAHLELRGSGRYPSAQRKGGVCESLRFRLAARSWDSLLCALDRTPELVVMPFIALATPQHASSGCPSGQLPHMQRAWRRASMPVAPFLATEPARPARFAGGQASLAPRRSWPRR